MSEKLFNSNPSSSHKIEFSPIVLIKHDEMSTSKAQIELPNASSYDTSDFNKPTTEKELLWYNHEKKCDLIGKNIFANATKSANEEKSFLFNRPPRSYPSVFTPMNTSIFKSDLDKYPLFKEKMQLTGITVPKIMDPSVFLNEIRINGTSLNYLPRFNCSDEELKVIPILCDNEFMNLTKPKIETDIPGLSRMTTNAKFKEAFKTKIRSMDLDDIKINSLEVDEVVRTIYQKIQLNLKEIQKNFMMGKRKSFNHQFMTKVEYLIEKCNEIFKMIIECINICKTSFKDKRKRKVELFHCEHCSKSLDSAQALGGHMSRVHPNQSEKYKMKVSIHNRREDAREALKEGKRILLSRYEMNYDELLRHPGGKKTVSKFVALHPKEYKTILRHAKNERKQLQD